MKRANTCFQLDLESSILNNAQFTNRILVFLEKRLMPDIVGVLGDDLFRRFNLVLEEEIVRIE